MFSEGEIDRIISTMNNENIEFYHDEPAPDPEIFEFRRLSINLVDIIRRQKDTPFSIFIHGEWGSGKTSLLKQSHDLLVENVKDENSYEVIWFDAWNYEKFDAGAGLLQ